VLEKKKKVFKDVTVSELTATEDFGLDELKDIFGFDMKRLAEKVRQRYGIRVETPLKRR
jgi:hypothetical protein